MEDVLDVSLSEDTPAGSALRSEGDERIREFKTQVRQIMDVDHDFPSSGNGADLGQHKKVTLQEQADIGTGAVGTTILGSQTVNAKGELVYTDEGDTDVQITKLGYLNVGPSVLEITSELTSQTNGGEQTITADTKEKLIVIVSIFISGPIYTAEYAKSDFTYSTNNWANYTSVLASQSYWSSVPYLSMNTTVVKTITLSAGDTLKYIHYGWASLGHSQTFSAKVTIIRIKNVP